MERIELGSRARRSAKEMKGSAFGDRARQLTEWFQAWNTCEQTIALYSLLSKVSATQARFLSLVLEHSLKNGLDSQELTRLERHANSAAYLGSLQFQSEDQALSQLLTHLPLLHPGNTEARKEYMKLLPKVLLGSSEMHDYLDQCRQLLSLALVHPAFPHDDREALTYWLKKLDEKHQAVNSLSKLAPQPPTPQTPSPAATAAPPLPHKKVHQIKSMESSSSLTNGGSIMEISGFIDFDQPSEVPLTSSSSSSSATMPLLEDIDKRGSLPPNSSIYDAFHPTGFTRANTLPARPSAKATISLSQEDIPPLEWNDGMKDVPLWLKSLRLHKYAVLFAPLSYEEMLDMQEDYLEKNNVTQGARKKIILSIRRLARRPETLMEIEQDLEKHGRLLPCISEMRQMLQTPLKAFSKDGKKEGGKERHGKEREERRKGARTEEKEEKKRGGEKEGKGDGALSGDEDGHNDDCSDSGSGSPAQHSSSDGGSDLEELLTKDFPVEDLPSLLSRAMGKAYSQLMLHTDTNEDNLGAFIKLLDSALLHEAFTLEHKKLFFEWKQQCQQTLRVLVPKKNTRGRNWGAYTIDGVPSHSNRSSRFRSIRTAKNGGSLLKGMGLPTSSRNSSTLPRMSPRATMNYPTHSFRPSSTVYPSSSPSLMNAHSKPFVPSSQPYAHLPPSSSSSCSSSAHPHKQCDEASFANLARGVANYILDDTSDS